MNFSFKMPPKVEIPRVKIPEVKKVELNLPLGIKKRVLEDDATGRGYDVGYRHGYDGATDLSEGKDTVNDNYWLGYSCGYRDGRVDRENGKPANC